jgi:hypothetical protein
MGMGCLHVSANLESVSGSGGDVRFGSKTDVTLLNFDVRFYPRKRTLPARAGAAPGTLEIIEVGVLGS